MTENQGESGAEQNEPTGRRDPNDPESRTSPEPEEQAPTSRDESLPAWFISLPPQLRDSIIRGDFENVPVEYRERVQNFLKWLRKQERNGSGN
ncbi:MAG: hypothetical protein ACYTG6_12080 [Planctomycetota bacterium]|jgi:hypothetical protein